MYLLKNAAPKIESLKKVQKLLAHVMTFVVLEMAPKWPQNILVKIIIFPGQT